MSAMVPFLLAGGNANWTPRAPVMLRMPDRKPETNLNREVQERYDKKRRRSVDIRTCTVCGHTFEPKRITSVICSDACRLRVKAKKEMEERRRRKDGFAQ